MHITALSADAPAADVDGLSDILVSCVAGGASVGFMADLTVEVARSYWRGTLEAVRAGHCFVLVARDPDGSLAGTAQLSRWFPPNQPHVGAIAMVLVHPRARRRGVARAMMVAVEDLARDLNKTMSTLQTPRGSGAERLYTSLGYQEAGVVPGVALWPDGTLCDHVYYWKILWPRV